MKAAIHVDNLSKLYRIGVRKAGYWTLRETLTDSAAALCRSLGRLGRGPAERNGQPFPAPARVADTMWALKDMSFEVWPGEVVGIIGRNGAGKSTLLKVLSRITEPTAGRVELRGRVGSLLEVGTGFHHELSGRENIFLNGAILGMTRQEIRRKFDDIVAFAEVGRFLDTPVKRYSSGMYIRLAFAVAAHLHSEILVVDEVLAVGDIAFQKKCLDKMGEVSRSGRTILFVTHNMTAMEGLCHRGIVLKHGTLDYAGNAKEAIHHYYRQVRDDSSRNNGRFRLTGSRALPASDFQVSELQIVSPEQILEGGFPTGAPLEVHLHCESARPVRNLILILQIISLTHGTITTLTTHRSGARLPESLEGQFIVTCAPTDLLLAPGDYVVSLGVKYGGFHHQIDDAACFSVLPTDFFGTGKHPEPRGGCVVSRQRWQVRGVDKPG